MSPIVSGIVASLAGRVTSGIMARLHRPQASFKDFLEAAGKNAELSERVPAWARQMALAQKRQAEVDSLAEAISGLPVTREEGREVARGLIELVEDLERAIESGVDVDIEKAVDSFVSGAADKYHFSPTDAGLLEEAAGRFLQLKLAG